MYVVYICCFAPCIPFLWFIPETKGKSLEEIGVIFGDRHVHSALVDTDSSNESMQFSDKQALPQVLHMEREK
jgi:hypothetical protein